MAVIWQDIEISFKGETYTIRPTLSLINLIESKSSKSLTAFVMKLAQQDIPVAWSAEIVAAALQYAGVKVTADEVFEEFGLSQELPSAAASIVLACLPPQKTTKLEAENAKSGKPKRQSK